MKKIILILVAILVLSIATIGGAFMYILHHHVVDFSSLAQYNPGNPTILLDDQGKEWARFSYDRREQISFDHMPAHLIQAFIAAEDWNFFKHNGISYRGIVRSTLVNFMHGRIVQGASTITQQLVKLLFFNAEKTFSRKIKEQLYAVLVEQQFTKEYILQTYLNHVYFGCGVYGVQAASQRFWGKSVEQLSLDEAATLAAIVRSPGAYHPVLAPESAKKRRNTILHSMKKLHFITDEQYQENIKKPLQVKTPDADVFAPHCKESIRIQLELMFGKEMVYGGGLVVQTTLSRSMQQHAQDSFKKNITELRHTLAKFVDGGLISVDVKTGAIKALVGGYDFSSSKFNRALQARRQMGSIFKPLIYAVAMQQGKTFADTEIDEPIDIMQHNAVWQPHNYNDAFEGSMTLARALIRSNNIIAIKTLLAIGYQPVIDVARRCHLPSISTHYPSLALGCIEATALEVVGMFSLFADAGIYHQPYLISWVKDQWGSKLFKAPIKQERVLDAVVTGQVAKVLEFGIERMRKIHKSELIAADVVSKTGTTNDSRTCWFAGATPTHCTVVYVGCDDNSSLGSDVYPLRTAFPIWLGLHEKIPVTQKHFSYDMSLEERYINQWTGRRAEPTDPKTVRIMVPKS